jgi:hypothetical protein
MSIASSSASSSSRSAAVTGVLCAASDAADPGGLDRFAASPAWAQVTEAISAHCAAVHAVRVNRCITTKYQGAITLAGVHGPSSPVPAWNGWW